MSIVNQYLAIRSPHSPRDLRVSPRFTYTITDEGNSDPRIEQTPGLDASAPLSDEAEVLVWVDTAESAPAGFSSMSSDSREYQTRSFTSSTTAEADGLCEDGRPQVAITWSPVEDATAYRVERRPVEKSTQWIEVATTEASSLLDALVGERIGLEYRVIPLRHRLKGVAAPPAQAQTPGPVGFAGC